MIYTILVLSSAELYSKINAGMVISGLLDFAPYGCHPFRACASPSPGIK
jgi:hypothetical protein